MRANGKKIESLEKLHKILIEKGVRGAYYSSYNGEITRKTHIGGIYLGAEIEFTVKMNEWGDVKVFVRQQLILNTNNFMVLKAIINQ